MTDPELPPWEAHCPERGPMLRHARDGDGIRCSHCGANPDAPWPSLEKAPEKDPIDGYEAMWEEHSSEARKADQSRRPILASRHRHAAGIVERAIRAEVDEVR